MSESVEDWAETDAGHIVVRETAPGRWRVSWYPNPGEPDFPGFTLDSETTAFPVDGGAAAILAWAKEQPWARRRRAAS